jgi:KDO2-lipid IV(A) lauroyltransferase
VLGEMVKAEGLENLDAALKGGRGAILLLAHFGSFLLPLPFLGHLGYRVNQVAGRQVHASFLGEVLWRWRKHEADKLPVNFIQVGRFLRPVYDALKRGEAVAIAFDGRDGANWEAVDFFERKALFSNGPFTLARRTGAAIVPTFMVRTEDDAHRLVLGPPFALSEGGSPEALHRDTERFAGIFARYVAEFPCHFAGVLYKIKKEQEIGNTPLFVEAR